MTNFSDRPPSDCLSILQLTDLHILAGQDATLLGIDTAYYFRAVLALAFARQQTFDLILLTGDLAQDPVIESYQYILKSLATYPVPCVCLPGNHDDYALMQRILNTERINCRKQVFLDHWQIICLNSQIPGEEGGRLSSEELFFLDDCLRRHPDKHALVTVHHHCLPTNSVWMDTMMIENSNEFLAIINQHPQAKAIVCGHIHQVMDNQTKNVRVWGTPSTCFQFKPESEKFGLDDASPAYRHLQLYGDGRIESEVISLDEPLTGLQTDTSGY